MVKPKPFLLKFPTGELALAEVLPSFPSVEIKEGERVIFFSLLWSDSSSPLDFSPSVCSRPWQAGAMEEDQPIPTNFPNVIDEEKVPLIELAEIRD